VEIIYHHNRYSSVLYDVDGNVLVGETGRHLNVFQEELKNMLIEKKIRFMHHMSKEPTYAYFITSNEQLGRFHIERFEGSTTPKTKFHVYPDY
jgi:phage antirepressor YoqD-like protein